MKATATNIVMNYLANSVAKSCDRERELKSHGTHEWSVKTVNCCTGCSHEFN